MALGFTVNGVVDVSLIVTLVGILFYYFGRLISDAKPQRAESSATYVSGFAFVTSNIVVPLAVIHVIANGKLDLDWIVISFLAVQYLMVLFLNLKTKSIDAQKIGIAQFVEQKTEQISQTIADRFFKNMPFEVNFELARKLRNWFLYQPMATASAFLMSAVFVLGVYIALVREAGLLYEVLSLILSILGLSLIAFLSNTTTLKDVEVVLDYGKSIHGKLNKIENDFVTIFKDNQAYNINLDKVVMLKRTMYTQEALEKSVERLENKS